MYWRLGCTFDTEYEFLIGSEGKQSMIQPFWWNNKTFYDAIHTLACYLVVARVYHTDDGMAHGNIKYLQVYK